MNLRKREVYFGKSDEDLLEAEEVIQNFIKNNYKLVHPNTLKVLHRRDNDTIRMALNQIHYGSIKHPSKASVVPSVKTTYSHQPKLSNHLSSSGYTGAKSKEGALSDFLCSYKHLIAPDVYEEAIKGDDKAVSLALGIIHLETLDPNTENPSQHSESSPA